MPHVDLGCVLDIREGCWVGSWIFEFAVQTGPG